MQQQSRSLIVVCLLASTGSASADETFVDKTTELGIEFANRVVVAWGYYDNDGWVDL